MKGRTTSGRRGARLGLAAVATAASAGLLAACSGGSPTAQSTTQQGATSATTPSAPMSTTPAASPSTAATTPASTGVSGTWRGQYSGVYSGTFVLNWRQSGSQLGGHIQVSDPAATLGIHGTLSGSSIRFGTVGSYRITYSGTVSGTSMSGNWQINGQGGTWSASKA